ncbi:proline-rich receptor-like protein kinase PERK2 [Vigna unguiculata]|uniref:proline-rich receptor-like protein kinase PERK2 n=1 Tax=Vigna unguiculata TaxID=3917 RepID=UPI001015D4D0|nr:proline-rich receptor-like protein kinase PERK2 [Vigna unguiculata]
MEALRQENSRLRRKIEADPSQKGKVKETSDAAGSPAFQPTKEESEYNPTPHTFTTTQQTLILSTHPTHFHSTLPGNSATSTPAATLPPTYIPPYNMLTTLHITHIPPYNPHNLPTTHIPPHNFTSTFPTLVHHPIPHHPLPSHQPWRRHPFTDFIANTPSPPSGNPSRWSVTLVKPTPMNTSKSTSPTSPSTLPMMPFFAKPFLPPSKALPSNGLPPSRHTPLTTSTPSPTCLPLISPAAACIKLQQYHSSASDKNKARRSGHSLIDSVRLPFANHTSTKK